MKTNKLGLVLSVFAASLIAVLFVSAPHAFAATATWTGGGSDTNMNTAANWGGVAPVAGDDLVFPANITNRTVANNYTAGTSFNTIAFSGVASAASNYTISGNSIVLVAGITSSMTGTASSSTISAPITLGGNQTFTISSGSGLYLYAPTFTISSFNLTVAIPNTNNSTIGGDITGSGTLTKTGIGTLSLGGDNSAYTGAIIVSGGELNADLKGIATSGGTTISDGAEISFTGCNLSNTFEGDITLTGASTTSGGIFRSPKVYVRSGGCASGDYSDETYGSPSIPVSVIFTGNITLGSDITFASPNKNVTFTGALSGAHAINLLDGYPGKLILNASTNTSSTPNGTYTPAVSVKSITDELPGVSLGIYSTILTLDGKRGDTFVSGEGAALKGTGSVAALNVTSGGAVAPGHSPGCLVVGAGLVLGGTYQAELGGTTVCSGYDQLTVTGAVDITGGTLATSLYGGFKPAAGDKFTIIDNDASDVVTGTFTGMAEGATFTVEGYVFKISYVGGSGNDVVITVQSVPVVPAVPNTGFKLLQANPYVTLAATVAMTGALSLGFRRLNAVRIKK
jgi:fibronectin-binding autotransporter adhesin